MGEGPEQVTAPAWTGDPLFALLGELREQGFPVGIGEYLEAQAAAAACRRDGLSGDPLRLRNYLAPVLCTNREQQQTFYRLFDRWWIEHAGGVKEDLAPRPQSPPPLRESKLGEVVRKTRPWKWWAAATLGTAAVVIGLVWGPSLATFGRTTPAPITGLGQQTGRVGSTAGLRLRPSSIKAPVITTDNPGEQKPEKDKTDGPGSGSNPIQPERRPAPEPADPILKIRVLDLAGRPVPGTKATMEQVHGRPTATLADALAKIQTASFSPDGSKLLTVPEGGTTVRIWSTATGAEITHLTSQKTNVYCASFSPDNTWVVVAYRDNTARIWNTATGAPLGKPMQHHNLITSAFFNPDGSRIVTSSTDATVRIWNAATGMPLGEPLSGSIWGGAASFSPDGKIVLLRSRPDESAKIWDAATGKPLREPWRLSGPIDSASFNSDGSRMVTVSKGFAQIWDMATGKKLREFGVGGEVIASFSPDGTRVVTASEDHSAQIWDASTGKALNDTLPHDGEIRMASFSPDGSMAVTASFDGTARIWDGQSGKPLGEPLRHSDAVEAASFSPNGELVLTTTAVDGKARLWSVASILHPSNRPVPAVSDREGKLSFRLDPLLAPQALSFTDDGHYSPRRYITPLNAAGGTLHVRLAPRSRWDRLTEQQRKVQAGLALLPLAVAGPWLAWRMRRRRQLVLERRATRAKRTASIPLPEPRNELYRGAAFSKLQVDMRRRLRVGSGDLDAEATVEATARRLGFFTPVFRDRLEVPIYLTLIDRTGFRDQRAQMVDLLLDRLQAGYVEFDRYDFDRDPRRAALPGTSQVHRDLKELAGLYPNHRLVVFADGAGFTHPVNGRLAPWVDQLFGAWANKTLLTPVPVSDWGRRELDLAAIGFAVLPANAAGIERLTDALQNEEGTVPRPLVASWQPPYPDLLAARPGRFLERHSPDPGELDNLCADLAFYLGPDGYRWLRALAVYPELDWHLTLYLGLLLRRGDGHAVLDETTLTALTRLPWLRHGSMPDWLRLRLLRDLQADDEKAVRGWLRQLLQQRETADSQFHLDVVRPPEPDPQGLRARLRRWNQSKDWRRLIKDLAHIEETEGPLRDQVFVTFLLGKKPSKLQVRAPSAWQRLAWEQGLRALGPRMRFVALLTLLLATWGFVLGGPYLEAMARQNSQAWRSTVRLEALPPKTPTANPGPVPVPSKDTVMISVKPPAETPAAEAFGPPRPPAEISVADTTKKLPQETPAQVVLAQTTPSVPPSPTDSAAQTKATAPAPSTKAVVESLIPVYDHIVIVVESNKNYEQIIGNNSAPYINQLRAEGANLTRMYAEEHPSQGNYFWLFSGSNQNVGFLDLIPGRIKTHNLGEQLIGAGRSFRGYAEDLPAVDSSVTRSGHYARKHVPWISFSGLPAGTNQRFSDFPTDYSSLPTVAIVIPNLINDMHDGRLPGNIQIGDVWLQKKLGDYYRWAKEHNSLLILTFDEDEHDIVGLTDPAAVNPAQRNHIVTILAGARIKHGDYSEGKGVTHVNLLRTLEAMYRLQKSGSQQGPALAAGITDAFFIADVFDVEQQAPGPAGKAAPGKPTAARPPPH